MLRLVLAIVVATVSHYSFQQLTSKSAAPPEQLQFPSTSTSTTMFQTRQVAFKFIAGEQGDGDGAIVRRSIGSHQLRNLDPFLMLDEAEVALPAGFPAHPHRGFETVSYSLPSSKGNIVHEDFLGNKGTLRPGDLQWMTAGRGIMHAEMPASTDSAHGLQLWVNLPKDKKMMEPRYQDVSSKEVPHVFNDKKDVEALVFAGEVFGTKGPVKTVAPVTYIHFIMQKKAELEYKIPEGHNAFVYMLNGSGKCAGKSIQAHEAIVLEKEGEGVRLDAGEKEGLEVIIISGQPLNEPIVQYGPFVMTTPEDIRQAFEDFHGSKNGFENAGTFRPEILKRHK